MKIGILSPAAKKVFDGVAKLAPEAAIQILGPGLANQTIPNGWDIDDRPYREIDFSAFDLVFETYELLMQKPDWCEQSHAHACPVALWVLHTAAPFAPDTACPEAYYQKIFDCPVILANYKDAPNWETSGFTHVFPAPQGIKKSSSGASKAASEETVDPSLDIIQKIASSSFQAKQLGWRPQFVASKFSRLTIE